MFCCKYLYEGNKDKTEEKNTIINYYYLNNYFFQSDEWLQGNMLTLMAAYDGPQATDEISKGWNKLFIEVSYAVKPQ